MNIRWEKVSFTSYDLITLIGRNGIFASVNTNTRKVYLFLGQFGLDPDLGAGYGYTDLGSTLDDIQVCAEDWGRA